MKTKYIDAEKLKAEIKRRFSEYNHGSNHHIQAAECASILDFLDTLQQEQSEALSGEDVMTMCNQILIDWVKEGKTQKEKEQREQAHIRFFELYDDYLMQEQQKSNLENEIKDYTETLYHETFGNDQGTLDEFDWEDIAAVIDETAHYFYNLNKK